MRVTPSSRRQLRLASSSFIILFLVAMGLVLWLSREYSARFDWTRGARNSLSEASATLLERLDKPIKITAYATEDKDLRLTIRDLVGRYQQRRADLSLEFVDPTREPARVREAGVRSNGELIVEYGGARESLQRLDEESLTNALARLGRGGERWVVFLSGHGERSPERQANHDLSDWANSLQKRGLKTRSLTLGEISQIPKNTSVLVIASPRVKLLPGEVQAVLDFVKGGGNLVWLHDPGDLFGLAPVAEYLGIEFVSGVIVDPVAQALIGSNTPDFVLITPGQYGQPSVVRGLTINTLFPEAAAISHLDKNHWRAQALFQTNEATWAESTPLRGEIRFDKGKDRQGPLVLGLALTREVEDREQRVVVVGDGDFLSNAFLGNGGNLDLGLNLVNWASQDDQLIDIPARSAPDAQLNLSRSAERVIRLTAFPILPLLFIGGGVWVWLRRRKR